MMIALGLGVLVLSMTASHEVAEIVVSPSSGRETAWHYVTYRLPADGVGTLALIDMSARTGHCPDVEYEIGEVSGVVQTAPHPQAAPTGLPAYFEPKAGVETMVIRFRVRMIEPDAGLSPASAAGCDLLISRGPSVFLDGKALLPAPRPADLNGTPFRFGATRVVVESAGELSTASTLGVGEDGVWHLDRFDEARFAYFIVGEAAQAVRESAGLAHVPLNTTPEPFEHLEPVAGRVASALAEMFGTPAPSHYLIVTIRGEAADFADYTGTARPGGQLVVAGPAAPRGGLSALAAHELAHNWDLARLRRLAPSEDWTWLREGLAELLAHIALARTGDLAPAALVHRANLALYNRDLPDTHGVRAYDEGYLAWFAAYKHASGPGAFEAFLRALTTPSETPLTSAEFWESAYSAGLTQNDDGGFEPETDLPCTVTVGGVVYALRRSSWPAYDAGLTFDTVEPGRIQSVTPGGPADRVGLRPGDRVEALISGGFGRIFEPFILRLEGGRTVSVLAHGASRNPYWQYIELSRDPSTGLMDPENAPCPD